VCRKRRVVISPGGATATGMLWGFGRITPGMPSGYRPSHSLARRRPDGLRLRTAEYAMVGS